MESTLYVTLSRQAALRREMAVIANNLANMNSTGFKREKLMFTDVLERSRGNERLLRDKVNYVVDVAQVNDMAPGPLNVTGNPLDLSLPGKGFFVIGTEQGERYTRNGNFVLDGSGQLVTSRGNPVLSDAGAPFVFGPTDTGIAVAGDGTVSTASGLMGRIAVVTFENEHKLKNIDGALYDAGPEQPAPADAPRVTQGSLETSNVEPIVEMTRMIEVQRAYESASKFIDEEHKRIKGVLQLMVTKA